MYWNWKSGGLVLGLTFLLAVALVKPIGVSTQFVIADGILAKAVQPDLVVADDAAKSGYASSNAYLNKSGGKYAKSVANPLGYGFLFVLSMVLGGALGRFRTKRAKGGGPKQIPAVHQARWGRSPLKRHVICFLGGALVLWGARLAGGCTSGHMMSGMMQTAMSGYVFAAAAFLVAVPVARLFYGKGA